MRFRVTRAVAAWALSASRHNGVRADARMIRGATPWK
jgi:hypothetical protein